VRHSPERSLNQTEETMELSALKSQICAAAREGQAIQKKIQTTRADERHALWNQKRALGRQTRQLLLAYGYVRGVAYRRIEPRCRRDNEVHWYPLANVLMDLESRSPASTTLEILPKGILASLIARFRGAVPTQGARAVTGMADHFRRRDALQEPLEAWLRGVVVTSDAHAIGARS
jgi:hypothetical protein